MWGWTRPCRRAWAISISPAPRSWAPMTVSLGRRKRRRRGTAIAPRSVGLRLLRGARDDHAARASAESQALPLVVIFLAAPGTHYGSRWFGSPGSWAAAVQWNAPERHEPSRMT